MGWIPREVGMHSALSKALIGAAGLVGFRARGVVPRRQSCVSGGVDPNPRLDRTLGPSQTNGRKFGRAQRFGYSAGNVRIFVHDKKRGSLTVDGVRLCSWGNIGIMTMREKKHGN